MDEYNPVPVENAAWVAPKVLGEVPLELRVPPIQEAPHIGEILQDRGAILAQGEIPDNSETFSNKPKSIKLADSISDSYRELPKKERRSILSKENIVFNFDPSVSPEDRMTQVDHMKKLGYSPLSLRYILGGVAYLAQLEGKILPFPEYSTAKDVKSLPKAQQQNVQNEQSTYINSIASRLIIKQDKPEKLNRLYIKLDEEDIDITDKVTKYLTDTDEVVEALYNNRFCIGTAIRLMGDYVRDNRGVLSILDSPLQSRSGPTIQISGENDATAIPRLTDKVVSTDKQGARHIGVLREVIRHGELRSRRQGLQEAIVRGDLRLETAFTRETWPTHPLMYKIKALAVPIIADEVKKTGVLCDDQDIRYQTLFRMATHSMPDLFIDGESVYQDFKEQGLYDSWRNIPKVRQGSLDNLQLNEDLVRRTVLVTGT